MTKHTQFSSLTPFDPAFDAFENCIRKKLTIYRNLIKKTGNDIHRGPVVRENGEG